MAQFDMVVKRPASFFLWKLMLPLVVVVLSALVALLVYPQSLDARLALPLGSLLAAIFLQKSYSDTIPDLGYLVLMDKIYLLAYPLILLVMIRAIKSYTTTYTPSDAEVLEIRKDDRKVMSILGIVLLLGSVLIVALR
ncbi:hypothetical protein KBY65_12565 [Cyanobium sp. Alchichica 3B3-8F6]|uniref:hypothetical protein n=1 Tax=Cyanobium sp. Alchichica 3B3-8F6 TaxID=2823696 RepID=UPI0020CDCF34|nr:hypothetical protein [Cyanobium sp. Alchichica 3B3-8F6]MCP9883295.1 hypothetical protein [Cyanobium sp. Alchichica 3B3-8F6]